VADAPLTFAEMLDRTGHAGFHPGNSALGTAQAFNDAAPRLPSSGSHGNRGIISFDGDTSVKELS
jgi:hypothetical protein